MRKTQRKLSDNTQHSQEADISASGGIRNRSSKKRAASAPRLDRSATGIRSYFEITQLKVRHKREALFLYHLCSVDVIHRYRPAFLKLFSSGGHFSLVRMFYGPPYFWDYQTHQACPKQSSKHVFATENPSFVAESRVGRVVNFIKCQSWERKFKDACCM